MKGKLAQVVVTAEPGYVFLGTAPLEKRTIGSFAFTPDEARIISKSLVNAADAAEANR